MAKDKSGLKGERESVSSMSQSKTHRSQCPQEKWRVNSLTLIRPWSMDNYKTLMAEFWQRWSPIERLNTSKVSCKPINAFGSRMVKITHIGIYFHGEKEFVYVDDQLNFTFLCIKTHIHGMLSRKLEFQSQLFYSIQKLVWITQMG